MSTPTESGTRIGWTGVALIAVLGIMPLPLASNRIWAQGLWLAVVGALALGQLWSARGLFAPGAALGVPRGMRLHMALLLAWTALIALQLVPLPAALRGALVHGSVPGFPVPADWAPLSVDPYSTRAYLARAVLMLLLQWLLLRVFDTRPRLRTLVWAWLAIGGVEAVLGIVLFATGSTYTLFHVDVFQGLHATGTFVYHNHFAGYMELMLALGIGWMIALLGGEPADQRDSGVAAAVFGAARFLASSKAPLRALLIVLVVALISSRSRMGNAGFFVALWLVGGATLLALRRAGPAWRATMRAIAVFMISIVVLDVAIIGGVVGIDKVVQRIEGTHLETVRASGAAGAAAAAATEESVEHRIGPGLHALHVLADFPVFGTGGGTFFLAYFPYRPREVVGFYDHAHDDYVEFAVESGAIGGALLLALLLWSQWRGWRLLLARDSGRFERGLAFASVMGVTEIAIHATVDFNLQNTTNAVLFLWLLSLPHWLSARRLRHERRRPAAAVANPS